MNYVYISGPNSARRYPCTVATRHSIDLFHGMNQCYGFMLAHVLLSVSLDGKKKALYISIEGLTTRRLWNFETGTSLRKLCYQDSEALGLKF